MFLVIDENMRLCLSKLLSFLSREIFLIASQNHKSLAYFCDVIFKCSFARHFHSHVKHCFIFNMKAGIKPFLYFFSILGF